MHITKIVTKDGNEYEGILKIFRPEENWISISYFPNDAPLGIEKKFLFDDLKSAVTEGQRININTVGDQDEIKRAREYLSDARKYNWDKVPKNKFSWE